MWIRQHLANYDLSLIESIRIERGRSRKAVGVYGKCFFPTEENPFYRLTCMIPGPFPCRILIRKPPLYINEDGTYPPSPKGQRRGLLCIDKRSGRRWYRMISQTELNDLDEAIIWIMAHEAFHYLRRTKQIPGRNNEIQADAYGDDLLVQFQKQREAFTQAVEGGELAAVLVKDGKPTENTERKRRVKKKVTKKATKPSQAVVTQTPVHESTANTRALTEPAAIDKQTGSLIRMVRSWVGLWSQPPAGRKTGASKN